MSTPKLTTGQLSLYAVFHLNLAFSSIPKSHYPLILDRCYWPLLDVARRLGIPFGLETTGYSLEIMEKHDASFVAALKDAWQQGQIEFIGAGYTQSILPLMPAAANRQNLKLGHDVYQILLGQTPTTAYVNEQTYSSGLVDLYLEAGYDTLFMEWNNPARFNAYPPGTEYKPQRIWNPDATRSIGLVWNDSIAFQKLQRVLNQSLSQTEYQAYLFSHWSPEENRAMPFYGSDAEIIDYHPGLLEAQYQESQGSQDLQRLVALLETLKADPRVSWTTPGQLSATGLASPSEPIRLESPEYPLPCKKQPKYNPTRWAVSGREDIHLNTRCYQKFRLLEAAESLHQQPVEASLWRNLLESWGSDLRTHTTEEKLATLRQVEAATDLALKQLLPTRPSENPLTCALWNPNNLPYSGPLVLEVQFPNKTLHGNAQLEPTPGLAAFQIEEIAYYQDGSVRWLKCCLMADQLPSNAEWNLTWVSGEKQPASSTVRITESKQVCQIETDAVSLNVLLQRGGAIGALTYKKLDDQPWVGTLPHGYFDDIALGADFYSGQFLLTSKAGEKATDLNPVTLKLPENPERFPIRIPIQLGLTTDIGKLWKTIYVYQAQPRIDLLYHFRFRDIAAASSRVGMMTILPEAFDKATLAYRTVNGGNTSERFALSGHHVTHSEPVSVTVSAQHGLGATQGWVAVEDAHKRVILKTYPHEAYAMPMVHYEESGEKYFLRILPSIGEFDDTSHTQWRGHHQVMFSWLGQHASDEVSIPSPLLSLSDHTNVLSV